MKLHPCFLILAIALAAPATSNADYILDDFNIASYGGGTQSIGGFTVTRNLTGFIQGPTDDRLEMSGVGAFSGSIQYLVAGGTFGDIDNVVDPVNPDPLNNLTVDLTLVSDFQLEVFVDGSSVFQDNVFTGLFHQYFPTASLDGASNLEFVFTRSTPTGIAAAIFGGNGSDDKLKLFATPEPTGLLFLGAFSAVGFVFTRRRR